MVVVSKPLHHTNVLSRGSENIDCVSDGVHLTIAGCISVLEHPVTPVRRCSDEGHRSGCRQQCRSQRHQSHTETRVRLHIQYAVAQRAHSH